MVKRFTLRWYLTGAIAARTGNEMSGPALLLAGLAATGSAASGSALLAGLTVAAAVGGPVVGVLLDRADRPGRLLAAALVLYAAVLAVITVLLGRVPLGVVVAVSVLGGLVGPALSGGWTAQLPSAVGADALPRATAYDAMTYNFATLVGPALAALAVGLSGATVGVLAALCLICTAAPVAAALPRRARPAEPGVSMRAGLASGFRVIGNSPTLLRGTVASVVTCVADGVLVACTPLLGERHLGGAARGAVLLSVIAASAFAANAVLARRPQTLRPDTVVWGSNLVLSASFAVAALGHPAALLLAAVGAGIGQGPQMAALFTIRNREAPDHLRGQVFTTGASLKITGFALGAALAGPAATWSLPGALVIAAGIALSAVVPYGVPARARPAADGAVGADPRRPVERL
ncbi:MFS transporter [Yinghuangia seranimata]|uniref:MFS transporter n=1 Tax=Yinghuangia seranimata TaxID=408067 RepID=UPI00248C836A|nr:MFS transporter [Yinghuangia seranimata]MDI2124535.1 MFS transporter [Yinghuangia seranimata]